VNLRQWARATHKAIGDQSAERRQRDFSMADVEMILRQSISVLGESLCSGGDLRLHDLGRLWVEQKAPHSMISNLPDQKRQYDLEERKVLRFQASARLVTIIRSGPATADNHAQEDR